MTILTKIGSSFIKLPIHNFIQFHQAQELCDDGECKCLNANPYAYILGTRNCYRIEYDVHEVVYAPLFTSIDYERHERVSMGFNANNGTGWYFGSPELVGYGRKINSFLRTTAALSSEPRIIGGYLGSSGAGSYIGLRRKDPCHGNSWLDPIQYFINSDRRLDCTQISDIKEGSIPSSNWLFYSLFPAWSGYSSGIGYIKYNQYYCPSWNDEMAYMKRVFVRYKNISFHCEDCNNLSGASYEDIEPEYPDCTELIRLTKPIYVEEFWREFEAAYPDPVERDIEKNKYHYATDAAVLHGKPIYPIAPLTDCRFLLNFTYEAYSYTKKPRKGDLDYPNNTSEDNHIRLHSQVIRKYSIEGRIEFFSGKLGFSTYIAFPGYGINVLPKQIHPVAEIPSEIDDLNKYQYSYAYYGSKEECEASTLEDFNFGDLDIGYSPSNSNISIPGVTGAYLKSRGLGPGLSDCVEEDWGGGYVSYYREAVGSAYLVKSSVSADSKGHLTVIGSVGPAEKYDLIILCAGKLPHWPITTGNLYVYRGDGRVYSEVGENTYGLTYYIAVIKTPLALNNTVLIDTDSEYYLRTPPYGGYIEPGDPHDVNYLSGNLLMQTLLVSPRYLEFRSDDKGTDYPLYFYGSWTPSIMNGYYNIPGTSIKNPVGKIYLPDALWSQGSRIRDITITPGIPPITVNDNEGNSFETEDGYEITITDRYSEFPYNEIHSPRDFYWSEEDITEEESTEIATVSITYKDGRYLSTASDVLPVIPRCYALDNRAIKYSAPSTLYASSSIVLVSDDTIMNNTVLGTDASYEDVNTSLKSQYTITFNGLGGNCYDYSWWYPEWGDPPPNPLCADGISSLGATVSWDGDCSWVSKEMKVNSWDGAVYADIKAGLSFSCWGSSYWSVWVRATTVNGYGCDFEMSASSRSYSYELYGNHNPNLQSRVPGPEEVEWVIAEGGMNACTATEIIVS